MTAARIVMRAALFGALFVVVGAGVVRAVFSARRGELPPPAPPA